MKMNSNLLNRIRYTIYTPFYDYLVRVLDHARKKSIELLEIEEGDKILIVGAGTGLDLNYLPTGVSITAIDITPSMIGALKTRNQNLKLNLEAKVMDGQQLDFRDASFDKIIFHLILAVIPDPISTIKEAERVLKPNGKITAMDKFVEGDEVSLGRRIFNPITNFLFSDITRSFEKIIRHTNLTISLRGPEYISGIFRIYQAQKK